jgi:hypothetical protein
VNGQPKRPWKLKLRYREGGRVFVKSFASEYGRDEWMRRWPQVRVVDTWYAEAARKPISPPPPPT